MYLNCSLWNIFLQKNDFASYSDSNSDALKIFFSPVLSPESGRVSDSFPFE